MVHYLVLRFRAFSPKLERYFTFRLVGLAVGLPNYLVEETGEYANQTRLLRVFGIGGEMLTPGEEFRPVPRELLPARLVGIRFCRYCFRYSYFVECPYCGSFTTIVAVVEVPA